MTDLLLSDVVWRLGWTLLHSLWQLLLIGAIIGLALACLSQCSASLRYGLACGGLATMYLPLIFTFAHAPISPPAPVEIGESHSKTVPGKFASTNLEPNQTTSQVQKVSNSTNPDELANRPIPESQRPSLSATFSPWMVWIVGFWLVIVGLLSIWNVGGWVIVQRLQSSAIRSSTESITNRLQQLANALKIRSSVGLMESTLIDSPLVIGWLRPVILLPTSLATGLTPFELDAILVHELAHIRRHDYLINILQTLTETLLFYHPVVWLLSRRIRVEREFCCDDVALDYCQHRARYARVLVEIERHREVPQYALALLNGDDKMTLNRIRRIMGASTGLPRPWLSGSGCLLILAMFLAGGISWNHIHASANEPVPQTTPKRTDAAPKQQETPWGKAIDGVQIRLQTAPRKGVRDQDRLTWTTTETPQFQMDIRNLGKVEIHYIPRDFFCEVEYDGDWYVLAGPHAYGGAATPLAPNKENLGAIVFPLTHDQKMGWVRGPNQTPLALTPGKHTVRVALNAPTQKYVSNLLTIQVKLPSPIPAGSPKNTNNQNEAAKEKTGKPKLMLQTDRGLPRVNLLVDGGFETPQIPGGQWTTHNAGRLAAWTIEKGTVDVVGPYWKAAQGKQSLDLSGNQEMPGTIYQDIKTMPGKTYAIRFWAAANPEPEDAKNPKKMKVFWGDGEIATLEFFAEEQTFQDVGWQVFEYRVKAYGETGRLKFQSLTNTPCGPILDEISVSLATDK